MADLAEWIAETEALFALGKPGHRVLAHPDLARLAQRVARAEPFEAAAGSGWSCVRAIAFNKSPDANWGLGWHQDRTIAVAGREPVPGYDIWSTKDGVTHVEPPFDVLERMVTARVHLDPVDETNAPLLVAQGSHRRGRVPEERVENAVETSNIETCHADAGDVWLYATPILHASARSASERSRRVIHLDFARDALPNPLEWAGIA
ncbi:MAG: phytanoyl-CoA dioxygenase family protein [Erythrobacter sp.]|nr:phytanoyl-CoA dioxygenase family protein [Erythrobacter sp.]